MKFSILLLMNNFIKNLALDLKGNTLFLQESKDMENPLQFDTGEPLEQRQVFFVHGGVATEDREEVRSITETQNNAIIIASYGTFSTGINIKNLHMSSLLPIKISNTKLIGRVFNSI